LKYFFGIVFFVHWRPEEVPVSALGYTPFDLIVEENRKDRRRVDRWVYASEVRPWKESDRDSL
jgi:hypothetical protein